MKARARTRHRRKSRYVLVHVHKGIAYSVKTYPRLDAAIRAGERLAHTERFNPENDDIDIWEDGASEAIWQHRDGDSFPEPGTPRLPWRDEGGEPT